jgi:hypothetical protein
VLHVLLIISPCIPAFPHQKRTTTAWCCRCPFCNNKKLKNKKDVVSPCGRNTKEEDDDNGAIVFFFCAQHLKKKKSGQELTFSSCVALLALLLSS